jgi:hypothetical protein
MKPLVPLIALFVTVASVRAQYSLIKSEDGVLVVSDVPGRKFSVDVPGSEIVPYGLKQADHPFLTVDKRFLQIMSVPLAEFHADAKTGDEAILRNQMEYETNFTRVPRSAVRVQWRKLANRRTALLWTFAPGGRIKRQVNLTFRPGNYVTVLVSAVDDAHNEADIERFLARIANSFHPK